MSSDVCYRTLLMMSTLVQVMAWCRQATSHYLNQCWPRSPTPYGVTRPQWVKTPNDCPAKMQSIFFIWRNFSCDQAALQMAFSVCLSVCPSVTPFLLCSHHRIIMKFSGVITNDQSKVHAKGQGQRSKVKVTEVTTQLNRFRTITPVWIHIWWWNDAYSLMLLRRGAILFFKVIRRISKSHGSKNRRIWPRFGVSGL